MRPRATDDVAPPGSSRLDLAPAARRARRLGVYGGSFDPPHAGHLWVAERARESFDLDHVVFVPARRPPHKPERQLAADGDRLAMIALLLGTREWASCWPGELRREGPSYSYDTLSAFRADCPVTTELFMIVGSDNLAGLPAWHRAAELLELAQPIVVHRSEAPLEPELLASLGPKTAARVEAGFLRIEPFEASATAIRAALAKGDDPGPALPRTVREYARLRGLYVPERSR